MTTRKINTAQFHHTAHVKHWKKYKIRWWSPTREFPKGSSSDIFNCWRQRRSSCTRLASIFSMVCCRRRSSSWRLQHGKQRPLS